MANADWIAIKNEYINTNISYRKLAEKYNIPFSTLEKAARKESWAKLKKNQCDKVETKLRQKTAKKIVQAEVNRIENIINLTDKVSEKLDKAIGQVEIALVNGEKVNTGIVDTYKLRQIIQSIKDIKDILTDSNTVTTNEEEKQAKMLEAIEKAVKNADK